MGLPSGVEDRLACWLSSTVMRRLKQNPSGAKDCVDTEKTEIRWGKFIVERRQIRQSKWKSSDKNWNNYSVPVSVVSGARGKIDTSIFIFEYTWIRILFFWLNKININFKTLNNPNRFEYILLKICTIKGTFSRKRFWEYHFIWYGRLGPN
jgi:hypothetical protein